jgi:hypothetical protein
MIDLSKVEEELLLNNSIERVINTSMRLVEDYAGKDEDQWINLEDWKALKHLTVKLFNDARNEVFKARYKKEAK